MSEMIEHFFKPVGGDGQQYIAQKSSTHKGHSCNSRKWNKRKLDRTMKFMRQLQRSRKRVSMGPEHPAKNASKRVEIAGVDGKGQIMALLAGTLAGQFCLHN